MSLVFLLKPMGKRR